MISLPNFLYILIAARFALSITLITAGAGKLLHPSEFAAGVIQYRILPSSLARWYGRLLPFIEVITGILLFLGLLTRSVSFVTAMIFLSFGIAVGINLLRKRDMPCFCFGTDKSDKMGWQTLVRIGMLLLLAITLTLNTFSLPALWQLFDSTFFANRIELLPIAMVSSSLLLLLSLVEIAPWSIRAWTSPGIRVNRQEIHVIWRRVVEAEQNTEENL